MSKKDEERAKKKKNQKGRRWLQRQIPRGCGQHSYISPFWTIPCGQQLEVFKEILPKVRVFTPFPSTPSNMTPRYPAQVYHCPLSLADGGGESLPQPCFTGSQAPACTVAKVGQLPFPCQILLGVPCSAWLDWGTTNSGAPPTTRSTGNRAVNGGGWRKYRGCTTEHGGEGKGSKSYLIWGLGKSPQMLFLPCGLPAPVGRQFGEVGSRLQTPLQHWSLLPHPPL